MFGFFRVEKFHNKGIGFWPGCKKKKKQRNRREIDCFRRAVFINHVGFRFTFRYFIILQSVRYKKIAGRREMRRSRETTGKISHFVFRDIRTSINRLQCVFIQKRFTQYSHFVVQLPVGIVYHTDGQYFFCKR